MAPPSARQLASPMRLKFSRPLSPSMSVVHGPPPPMFAQPDTASATATSPAEMKDRRFMTILPLLNDLPRSLRGARAEPPGSILHRSVLVSRIGPAAHEGRSRSAQSS